jgi:hypothetical protein
MLIGKAVLRLVRKLSTSSKTKMMQASHTPPCLSICSPHWVHLGIIGIHHKGGFCASPEEVARFDAIPLAFWHILARHKLAIQ